MRLLLDEHVDKAVAAELRSRGFDVIAVTENEQLLGVSDDLLLAHAHDGRRAVVTYDVADFRILANERLLNEEHHRGLVLVNRRRFRHGKEYVGALIEALAGLLAQLPADDALADRELWL